MKASQVIKNIIVLGLKKIGLLDVMRPKYRAMRHRLRPPRFREGSAALPRHLNLATTFICLAACPHCLFIQEDKHVFRGKKIMDNDLGNLALTADWAKKLDAVSFDGGESLLHPHLFEWLKLSRDQGIASRQIVTNGVPLQQDEIVDRLLEKPAIFTNLQVSLDADNAEDFMASKGIKKVDFEKILDSIRKISAVHKDNPEVEILLSYVIGAHNVDKAESLIRLSERLGVSLCHFHTLHLVKEDGSSYTSDTLRSIPPQYRTLMEQDGFSIDVTLSPPLQEPFLGYYCRSLAEHVSIDPQGRMAVCCHIPWDAEVGMIDQVSGNPMLNEVSLDMQRKFIAAAKSDDPSLLPSPCRLCNRRLIGFYHFDAKTKKWMFNYE